MFGGCLRFAPWNVAIVCWDSFRVAFCLSLFTVLLRCVKGCFGICVTGLNGVVLGPAVVYFVMRCFYCGVADVFGFVLWCLGVL